MSVRHVQPVLDVYGIAINQKLDVQGNILGYFVAEFDEDLTSLDGAVAVAEGMFCIEAGLVDVNGDPDVSMLRELDA